MAATVPERLRNPGGQPVRNHPKLKTIRQKPVSEEDLVLNQKIRQLRRWAWPVYEAVGFRLTDTAPTHTDQVGSASIPRTQRNDHLRTREACG